MLDIIKFILSARLLRVLSVVFAVVGLLCSCSSTRYVPDGEYLLRGTSMVSESKDFPAEKLDPYVRQHSNSKWFNIFKIPLGIYDMSGQDTTKWINRILRRMGEAPVIYDSAMTRKSCDEMLIAMHNMGYMQACTSFRTIINGRKLHVEYSVTPGRPYFIDSVRYDIKDPAVASTLSKATKTGDGLKKGQMFSADLLEAERKRIVGILLDSGYFKFNKDFIHFIADSTEGNNKVDLTLRLLKYRRDNKSPITFHPKYTINRITYQGDDGGQPKLRLRTLLNNTAIRKGGFFSASDLQRTYNNFAKLQAVRYTNIRFNELPDTSLLDCNIQISTNKPNTISFQPEGTNTAGNLGAAASLTYENRNLFRGSEVLSIQLRAAFEAITGLEGYQNQDYEEYGAEAKLLFPRFIAPFLSKSFRRKSIARSELLFSYNLQNRPEFHRRVLTSAWRYHWNQPNKNTTYRLDLIDLNYVYMPWISSTFKKDYLDDTSSRNAILRYNYEDLFIMKLGWGITYNNGTHAIRMNVETAGNVLNLASHALGVGKNGNGQYTLFNIAYAQYAKFDFDYTRLVTFDSRNSLALHFDLGVSYPYGNSHILPFEKRYFSGGANSVRGWSVRGLGPGKYRGTDVGIDFINQTGDMKLDFNIEYRTSLFWKLDGAAFIDAGNIWTIREYKEQPGGQFRFDEFYKQIAVSYGLGIRLNLDYFVIRLDMGMKAINPAYDNAREHFPIVSPNIGRDMAIHFAVGLPF